MVKIDTGVNLHAYECCEYNELLTHFLEAFVSFPVELTESKCWISEDSGNVTRATSNSFIWHLPRMTTDKLFHD